jgi:hypothetical protein
MSSSIFKILQNNLTYSALCAVASIVIIIFYLFWKMIIVEKSVNKKFIKLGNILFIITYIVSILSGYLILKIF